MDLPIAMITFAAGLTGVILGGLVSRRNEKKAYGERLLVEALNDAATAIAEVAGGEGKGAQNRYASAMSRIALHASPGVISKFRDFQDDATTTTADGRERLIDAVQEARRELGHEQADDKDLAILLFGNSEPQERFMARCNTQAMAIGYPEPPRSPSVLERSAHREIDAIVQSALRVKEDS